MALVRRIVRDVLISVVLFVLGVISLGTWFVMSHRTSAVVSPASADLEFSRLLNRFDSDHPLLDMASRTVPADGIESPGVRSLRSFHTVIFDTRGGQRLVRISVPYWFARRFAGPGHEFRWLGQLTFLDDTEFDPEAIRLSLDQLERRGPGLVAYYRHASGGQFISWVE